MTDDLKRLEQRVAQLEAIVRRLAAQAGLESTPRPAPPARPEARPPPQPPAPSPQLPSPRLDWEQWVGQRGLLAVGVLALLATGGFFLNYAFERGWVPAVARAAGAAVAGVAVAAWGDRLVSRGLRRYGAALIGGGGGLVYLGAWAAAGPYALIGREPGVALLATVAALVAAGAVRHRVEALAGWALLGAYLAPAFLPTRDAPVEKLLVYLAVVGLSSGVLARRMDWRATLGGALTGYFLLAVVFGGSAIESPAALAYFAAGGVAGLAVTGGKPWPEARLAVIGLPWALILMITIGWAEGDAMRWTALAGGLAVATTAWVQHRARDPLGRGPAGGVREPAEVLVYLVAPLAPVFLAAQARPDPLVPWGGVVALALAALYVGGGWGRRAGHLVGMGVALLALAIAGQWDDTPVAVGWAAVALAAVVADRVADQPAARNIAAGVALGAFLQLFSAALAGRPAAEPAFVGQWAFGWYGVVAGTAAAAWWWRVRPRGGALEEGRSVLWLAAAATVLLGGSLELQRLLRNAPGGAERAALAGQVAMSIFWLAYAGTVVALARRWRPPRLRTVLLAGAVGLVALSFLVLFAVATGTRPASDPAFSGVWSLGWYAQCILPALAARWWRAAPDVPRSLDGGAAILWTLAGAAVLVGGSIELHRVFPGRLAGDLAISTYWLACAGALVWTGFRLDRRPVRSAGLAVAGLAALKIAFYDLAELEALYRVGSFFALALISLAVAYAYNQKASR